jgi:hypothetical protein
MLTRYVYNWYSVVAFYLHIIPKTTAHFVDGTKVPIRLNDFAQFYERIYRLYLADNGFSYLEKNSSVLVKTPEGLQLFLYTRKPYSFVLDEIFVLNIYSGDEAKGRVVIDVGASIGDSALYFMKHGAVRVFAYEPDVDRYDLARRNIRLNNFHENIILINNKATPELLSDLILENTLTDIFMKIDCEGCEYQIIEGIRPELLTYISVMVMEYHRKPEPLIKKLAKCGFNIKLKNKENIIYATR